MELYHTVFRNVNCESCSARITFEAFDEAFDDKSWMNVYAG